MTKFKEGYIGKEVEEKRNLYLISGETEELIATNLTLNEAFAEMNRYLDKVNFKSYYVRTWDGSQGADDRRMIMDFGSHYKFFHWANKSIKKNYERA